MRTHILDWRTKIGESQTEGLQENQPLDSRWVSTHLERFIMKVLFRVGSTFWRDWWEIPSRLRSTYRNRAHALNSYMKKYLKLRQGPSQHQRY